MMTRPGAPHRGALAGGRQAAHGAYGAGARTGPAVPARLPAPGSSRIYTVPFLIVLSYLLVDYGRPHNWIPALGVIHPGALVLGGGILSLLSQRAASVQPLGKYVLAFLALMAVLVPFSFNPHMAFNLTRDFALFVFGALLPLMVFVDSYDRLRIMIRFWVWIHVPLALYSITHQGVGIGSFLGDENDFALAMNMVLPYAIALIFLERGVVRRAFLLAASLILVVATTATMSRGGFVGLVCVGIFLWLRSPHRFASLVLVLALSGTIVVLTPASYWKEMQTIRSATEEGDTGAVRLYLWGIGWRMFRDHPILGVGPGNYQYNNVLYESVEAKARGRYVWGQVAHSLYFTLLPEYGVVGTTLFVAMLVRGVRERRRLSRVCRTRLLAALLSAADREQTTALLQFSAAIDAALVTFLVTGSFISVLYYPHVWLLTAFTAAMVRIGVPSSAGDELSAAAQPIPAAIRPGGRAAVMSP
jgi:O-antigen ligase